MSAVETVKIKQGDSYAVINRSDYDPKTHKLAEPGDHLTKADSEFAAQKETERLYEANRGVSAGVGVGGGDRNPSGTYSEPTPTDIRYPNKNDTEFENNHGAFVKKSAADLRAEQGLPDQPGGLNPARKEHVDAVTEQRSTDAFQSSEGAVGERLSDEALEGMTRDELKDEAERRGVDLQGATKKADIIERLKA